MGSFASKLYTYDPLTQLGVNKYTDPVGDSLFGNYSKSSGPGTPGPYAGVTPTLAAANAGYGTGGPGATPGVAGVPQNVYAAAAQQGAAQPGTSTNTINNLFGAQQQKQNPAQRPMTWSQ